MLLDCGPEESKTQALLQLSDEGRRLFSRIEKLAHGMAGQDSDPLQARKVTRRQEEIIGFLSQGLSSKEIGRELGLSESTVNNHIHSLYRKYKVSSRLGLTHALKTMGYFERV